tara:strand:- start:115795 stop:117129 length:1335 start_codon:yes stop_codon:yes gene_type:complete
MGSKSKKRKPTNVDLAAACDALGYELATLQDAVILSSQANVLGMGSLRNVALESLVLHTRVLIEFFYNPSYKGHFRAEDFFEEAEVWKEQRSRGDTLEWPGADDGTLTVNKLESLCNAHAAHLGWNRVLQPEDAEWNPRAILMHFDKLAKAFISTAEQKHITLEVAGTLDLGEGVVVSRYRWRTAGPHSDYLPFITDFTGTCASALKLLGATRSFGRSIIEQNKDQNSTSPVPRSIMVFIARSTNCLDSIEALYRVGQADDAFSVMRTICELTIDLAYMLKEDTERRFKLFFGFEHLVNFRQAQFIFNLHGGPESEAFQELRNRHNEVSSDYPDSYSWAGNKLWKRAKEAGLSDMYQSIYAEGCSAVHSGPVTLRNAYNDNNGQIEIYLGSRRPDSTRVLELTVYCYLRQLASAIDFLGLPEETSAACNALFRQLQTLPDGEVQ